MIYYWRIYQMSLFISCHSVTKKWKSARNICKSVSNFNQGIYKNLVEKIMLLLFYLANEDIQQKTKWEKFPFEKIDICLLGKQIWLLPTVIANLR